MPQTRFFTTLHPKIITLSPGTTFTLPITFRPLDKFKYEDFLEVNQLDFQKTFKISLTADLPKFKIELIDETDLGSCAVNEIVTKQIKLKNLSELDTLFEWDFKAPFSITPISGEIKAHSSIDITILFKPTAALIYKCLAICKYGNFPVAHSSLFKTIEINGTGKYPHLLVENENLISSEATLDFGKVVMGESATKFITIVNMTEVRLVK